MNRKWKIMGHRRWAMPLIYFAIAMAAWLVTTLPSYGLLPPTDGYQVTGRMYSAPQLWVAVLAGCSAWHVATLRNRGFFKRSTARAPLMVVARLVRPLAVIATLSLLLSLIFTCANFGIFEVSDSYLLLVTWAMGLGAAGIGAVVGALVPRLFALPVALAGTFLITYLPVTMKSSWVRSLVGGNWAPTPLYRIDGLTLFGTTLIFGAFAVSALAMLSARLPGARRRAIAIGATLALICSIGLAGYSVRNIGYNPTVARDIDTICSDTTPQWCVAPWNADELADFLALNPKIHEIERRTGARFPARLSQEAPPGPGLSTNVDALQPLGSLKRTDGTRDSIRTAEVGLSGLVNPCQQVAHGGNLTVAVYASEWWGSQLSGKPLYSASYHSENDVPSMTIRAMSEREQAAWVNSVFEAPKTCDTPLGLPGLDENGRPLTPPKEQP